MAHYPRIRDLREDNDKKQHELAEYLGTTAQYYGLYEKGANEITFERAIMLAKYYDVSLDYLAGLTNNKKGFSKSDISQEQQKLLELACSMTEDQRGIILKLAELIKNI